MKRYISLSLAAVILVFSMAVPSYAADFENDSFVELLDYSTANNSGTNYFDFRSSASVSYSIPFQGEIDYVDLVVFCSGATPSHVYEGSDVNPSGVLTISHINGNYYRVYGKIYPRALSTLQLFFTNDGTGHSWYTIFSLKIGLVGSSVTPTDALWHITASDVDDYIYYSPSNSSNSLHVPSAGNIYDSSFIAYARTDNWRDFDYIDFQFMLSVFQINSISASMDGISIPLEISYIANNTSDNTGYLVNIRMDVSGLDRTSSSYPFITFTGVLHYNSTSSFGFINCLGFLDFSREHTFEYFFRSLRDWFSNLDSAISSWGQKIVDAFSPDDDGSADEFQDSVSQQAGELSGIADAMGSLEKPDPDSMNVDLDSFAVNANISGVGSVLAIPMNNEILLQVLIMTFTFALVGYGLFGKR